MLVLSLIILLLVQDAVRTNDVRAHAITTARARPPVGRDPPVVCSAPLIVRKQGCMRLVRNQYVTLSCHCINFLNKRARTVNIGHIAVLTYDQLRTITHRFLRVACCFAAASSVVLSSQRGLGFAGFGNFMLDRSYTCATPRAKSRSYPAGTAVATEFATTPNSWFRCRLDNNWWGVFLSLHRLISRVDRRKCRVRGGDARGDPGRGGGGSQPLRTRRARRGRI